MPGSRLSFLFALTAISAAAGFGDSSAGLRSGTEGARMAASFYVLTANPPEFRAHRPLPFYYDLYTYRGRGGRTTVVSAYAVEAGELETEDADNRVRYRFSVTLVLADTATRSVSNTHDTVYVDVARPLADDHLLYTHVEVLARPTTTTLQRVLMMDATTPGIGQLYTEGFLIPDYSGRELMLSDIALAQPNAGTGWKRGSATLALLPTSQFPTGAFDVYYEIYNLPVGRLYTTEITVEHVDRSGAPGDRQPVRLRFEGESAAGRDHALAELRRVETSLSKGSYRITVAITDQTTGATATRTRDFDVRGGRRGATMVAAVPLRTGPYSN